VADAREGKKHSCSGSEILDQYEAIQDPEASSAFYKSHREDIQKAQEARNQP
jgi:HD-GYP domain-containing protein (c-di-GMP phosphodiesterase class II)